MAPRDYTEAYFRPQDFPSLPMRGTPDVPQTSRPSLDSLMERNASGDADGTSQDAASPSHADAMMPCFYSPVPRTLSGDPRRRARQRAFGRGLPGRSTSTFVILDSERLGGIIRSPTTARTLSGAVVVVVPRRRGCCAEAQATIERIVGRTDLAMPDRAVYLTREGFKRLDSELEHLRTVKRPEVSERIRRSKDMTDVDGQRRVRRGQERAGLRSKGGSPSSRGRWRVPRSSATARASEFVGLGSRVTVKDDEGDDRAVPDRRLDGGRPETGS